MANENEENSTPKPRFKKPSRNSIIIAAAVTLTVIGGVVVLGTKIKPAEAIEAAAEAVK